MVIIGIAKKRSYICHEAVLILEQHCLKDTALYLNKRVMQGWIEESGVPWPTTIFRLTPLTPLWGGKRAPKIISQRKKIKYATMRQYFLAHEMNTVL